MKTGTMFIQVLWVIFGDIASNLASKVSPVHLSSPSGSFTTPTFPSRYPPASEYVWLIKVAKDHVYIKLTFDIMDIEAYRGKCIDIVEIKDGDSSKAPLIGGFCNANKPAHSITSSGNTLRIWFQSARNSDGGEGFNASYTTLKDEVCGGQLRSFPGSFSTPRYPLPYPNNRECVWNIMAAPDHYVYVEFHGKYHLEVQCFSMQCVCIDTLDIKDGKKELPYPPNNGYCFTKPRPFTSKTNSVSLKFVADNADRFEGFNVTYSTSLTSGCGADLFHDNGVISSPNFPHSYHSSRRCIWRITVATGHYVTLKFHKFDVNKVHDKCLLDSLKIHDGITSNSTLLAKLCNANSVAKVDSSGNQLYIEFTAGLNIHAKGFKATYTSHLKANATNRNPRHSDEHKRDYAIKGPSNAASNISTLPSSSLSFGFFVILVLIL